MLSSRDNHQLALPDLAHHRGHRHRDHRGVVPAFFARDGALRRRLERHKPHLVGRQAFEYDHWDIRHTLAGAVLNVGAVALWSGVQSLLPKPRPVFAAARNAGVVSTLAYLTDYHLVPRRLTPGFEQRLSRQGLFRTYAVLAASLAVGALALGSPRKRLK